MKHVNLFIGPSCLFVAHPLVKPKAGKFIRITEVPKGVTPATVLAQTERVVLVAKDEAALSAPAIVPWGELDGKVQGSIVRY